jgi:hypothetical protein
MKNDANDDERLDNGENGEVNESVQTVSKGDEDNKNKESVNSFSDEDGLRAAIKAEDNSLKDDSLDDDREFLKYLKFCKKAKELGLNEPSFTTIYHDGIHIKNSDIKNSGNISGKDQTVHSNNFNHDTTSDEEKADSNILDNEECESIELIFDGCDDLKKRSFMMALTTLNGCNYRVVAEASERLQAIIQPKIQENTISTTPTSLKVDVTEKKRSQWLKDIFAYLNESYELTEYGKSRINTVSFSSDEAPSTLLYHIWLEYDDYARAIIQWLFELAEHSDVEVRLRAAVSVGQLAIYEFRPIREQVLSAWAKSNTKAVQRLSALALAVVAYNDDEEVSVQSVNLLHHWSSLHNSPRLQWTAIAAYGGYIGLLFPQQALDNLTIIAQSGSSELFPDIVRAISNLFDAGQQISGLHSLVLNTLRQWIEQSNKKNIHKLGLIAFWGIMRDSWIVKEESRLPALLWLAKENQDSEELVIYCLRKALALQLTQDLMISEILDWLKLVDKEQVFYNTLARIVFFLAKDGTEKEQARICHYLNKWSKDSETATKILNLIYR